LGSAAQSPTIPAAFTTALARSLLAGQPSFDDAYVRTVRTLGRRWFFLKPLVRRYLRRFSDGTRPRLRDVLEFLENDRAFVVAYWRYRRQLRIVEWIPEQQVMQPISAAAEWNVPAIENVRELAQWLSLTVDGLEWFADLKALGKKTGNSKLEHYHYRMLRKRNGRVRLIEMPKRRLKEIQRRILVEILERIPAHSSSHGFVKGRSIVTFAAPHVGKQAVLRLDLEDFFPAFPAARSQALFRTLGYPESVADRLGGICSNAVSRSAWARCPVGVDPIHWSKAATLYSHPHLPQGAPTSPLLANITAYCLDCRLTGLAESVGAKYTRYADDLAFSGNEEFVRSLARFSTHVAAIAMEEGFNINFHKTRIMRRGVRQHLAGVVVNEELNLKRSDLDKLEAILTNAVRHGPTSQNREGVPDFRSSLEGRLGFVQMVNPAKAARLRELLSTIDWSR
jgi:hypothetical protein